jgi:hypothetical protein
MSYVVIVVCILVLVAAPHIGAMRHKRWRREARERSS